MKYLAFIIMLFAFQDTITVVDFSQSSDISSWKTTNDDVMGGISTSSIALNENGKGVFSGHVSTENNGGFAMVKSSVAVALHETSKKVVLRLKGEGKAYQFRVKSNPVDRHWYTQKFTTSGDWETIEIDLNNLYPIFRGNRLRRQNFNHTEIKEIAFLIGNKQNENFKLIIDSIKIN
ncbi:CIA30 family protein [uncultured Tenacibaculum sp.]|uniref:CIA30 family protein n=1 Tax=uncultured Tenacibaculum sp. TaxID=174713 RepID=UPI00262EF620|nr:CIA30 family protein [uncultured Tenacibaculum sp.]